MKLLSPLSNTGHHMNKSRTMLSRCLLGLSCFGMAAGLLAADATFFRAINFNGPAVEIDGRKWDGTNATNIVISGKTFENQAVALKPATDPNRAQMIRSSVWGDKVDVTLTGMPRSAEHTS